MKRRLFTSAGLITLLGGCAAASHPDAPRFSGLVAATPGQAQLYIFRPAFEQSLRNEAPHVSLDGHPLGRLAQNTVISVSLSPGARTVSLSPAATESRVWNKSVPFTAERDQSYFLAMWLGVEGARTVTLVPVAGAVLPIGGTGVRAQAVRHEFVTQEQAMEHLPTMQLVLPSAAKN